MYLSLGAGPSGLAAALLLYRNGISVRIVEKRGDFRVGMRGAGIQARTLELYKLLGILPEIEKHTLRFPLRKLYDSGNQELISQKPLMDDMPLESHFHRINSGVIRQEQHQNILRETLQKEYGCVVETSTELESFAQDSDGVSVKLAKEGRQEATRFKWLIGADGARSIVRKQLGLSFLGESPANIAVVIGDIEVEQWGDVDSTSWSIWGNQKEKSAFLMPYEVDGRKLGYFMLGGAQMNAEEVSQGRQTIVDAFFEISGKKDILFGPLYTHALWRLISTLSGSNPTPTERSSVIAAMLQITTAIMRTDVTAEDTSNERWRRGFETRQLGITYRNSPVLVDERYPTSKEKVDPYRSGLDGTVHAGDRAPEAPGMQRGNGGSTSIYDLFDVTSHTVILFGKSDLDVQDTLAFVARYPGTRVRVVLVLPQGSKLQSSGEAPIHEVLVDAEGHAYRNYRVQPGDVFVVVVRPDGYIGALNNGYSGLKEYFSKIFV
ncbi:hypothetical protein VNI00_000838 [Paramarasmius palmivorus]|uniref:FAD-binding domain-containing protein n=1 Tax=Paramarasmius palmivorus TaxID=297713 RepID=A0AAW0EC63_9AGAR